MTVRAIILGLIAAAVLASAGYVNDTWLLLSYIGGDLLPTHAFGLVLLGLLLVAPVLRRLRRLQFAAAEWVVMLSLMLMGSVLAGSGLFWTFPHPLITPIAEYPTRADWQKAQALKYVPPIMLVDAEPGSEVVTDFRTGAGRPGEPIAWDDVPWAPWAGTLAFWLIVLALGFLASILAAVIVHRQWSQRESLAYPIARLTDELIRHDGRGVFNPIFRSKPFWLGFGASMFVLLVNGYAVWNPESIVIPMEIDLAPARELLGPVAELPMIGWHFLRMRFFFAAVGVAFFLSSDVAFSMGISGWMYALVAGPLFVAGVNMQMTPFEGGLPAFMYFGAYLGMALMVFYLGRRFYASVLKRVLFLGRSGDGVRPYEVIAGRLLVVICAALVVLFWRVLGLHPLLGAAFVLMCGVLFLMLARLNVAAGLFVIQPMWHPVDILVAALGGMALGPQAMIVLAMLCTLVTIDPRIAVTPLAANALRLGDLRRLRPGRLAGGMSLAIVVALLVSVPVTLYVLYALGSNAMDSPGTRWSDAVARMPFNMLSRKVTELRLSGDLSAAEGPVSASRLVSQARATPYFYAAAGAGMALVLACSYLRLRFPRWPLHPLVFLVWGTPWMVTYAPSFFVAWLLKTGITKLGGMSAYHRAKGFFLGLVAGEVMAALFWAGVSTVYYLTTGVQAKSFLVRP